MGKQIAFDPADLRGMRALMDNYGGSAVMYPGVNENGEDTHLSVYPDRVVCATLQRNGWERIDTCWRDGTREETFGGRWK